MTLVSALAVFFIIWWLTLFIVLPWGVRNAGELGQEVEKGHVSSAPVNPRIARKFAITTLLACVIFAVVYWVLTSGVISLDDFTFLPEFRPIQ